MQLKTITEGIIDLHQCGYDLDFVFDGKQFICVQDNSHHDPDNISVSWYGSEIDSKGNVTRFLHRVKCKDGQKGIYMNHEIFKVYI